jgi:hypothetical protein
MSVRPLLVSGYPRWTTDLFVEVTNALYSVFDSLFSNLPDHIISGCQVAATGQATYNVSPGLVYVDGKVRRFAGAVGVALPLTIGAPSAPTTTHSRPLYAGGAADTASVHDAVIVTNGGGGSGGGGNMGG